ncbi:amino acid synthesis family protein [Streptomyces sp. NPDC090075]|uniref:amino acid synthesis family protein n=1 Tax=Streptomyces sp. NPDC090075 TaxID=3365937 RepID=UPI003827AB4E
MEEVSGAVWLFARCSPRPRKPISLQVGRTTRGALKKAAVCSVVATPFVGRGDVADLVGASHKIGTRLGEQAVRLLGEAPQSYGKAGLLGANGEQEHVYAALASTSGNALRDAIGGGKA